MAETVSELIEELSQYPANARVVMARDPEGNGFHFNGVEISFSYYNESYEECYSEEDYKEMKEDDPEIELELVVCLWP